MSATSQAGPSRSRRPVVVGGVLSIVVITIAGILLIGGAFGRGPESAAASIRVYQCPQGVNLLGEIPAGTQVGIIGRTADGAWLQFYHQAGDFDRVWAERAALAPAMDVTPLPIADCGSTDGSGTPVATIVTAAGASSSPGATQGSTPTATDTDGPTPGPSTAPPTVAMTAGPSAGPTAAPTPIPTAGPSVAPTTGATVAPTAGPTATLTSAPTFSISAPPTIGPSIAPTPLPTVIGPPPMTIAPPSPTPLLDVTGPALSLLGQSAQAIYIPAACDPNSVDISVTAEDPSGVSSVTLWYKPPTGIYYLSKSMSIVKGTSTKALWRTTVTTNSAWSPGEMLFYVTALDTKGNDSRLPTTKEAPRSVNVYSLCLVL